MSLHIELPPELIEQVAERAAELLAERNGAAPKAERWLTHEEASRHLNISSSQLYSLASQRHRNGLPLVKEGSRSYYRASDLDRWRVDQNGGSR